VSGHVEATEVQVSAQVGGRLLDVGIAVLWPEILALTVWGIAILALAVARSRTTLG